VRHGFPLANQRATDLSFSGKRHATHPARSRYDYAMTGSERFTKLVRYVDAEMDLNVDSGSLELLERVAVKLETLHGDVQAIQQAAICGQLEGPALPSCAFACDDVGPSSMRNCGLGLTERGHAPSATSKWRFRTSWRCQT